MLNRAFNRPSRSAMLSLATCISTVLAASAGAAGGTWTTVTASSGMNPLDMYIMQDGSILVNSSFSTTWKRLVPSATGSYVAGSWVNVATAPNSRLYHAGAILKDGRFLFMGGEYVNGSGTATEDNTGNIYDPTTNTWSTANTPGWADIGDANIQTLPNGKVLMGNILASSTAVFDPATNVWTAGPTMTAGRSNEETWMMNQQDTIVTAACISHPQSEKYVASTNSWLHLNNLPQDLVDSASAEIGAGLCLYTGDCFITGGTGRTALYTPGANDTDLGTWTMGSVLPLSLIAADANMALEPNGTALFTCNPPTGSSGVFTGPTSFYEYTPSGTPGVFGTLTSNAGPTTISGGAYTGRMCLLPTGQIAYTFGSTAMYIYTPSSLTPNNAWRPIVLSTPAAASTSTTFTLVGQQLCGLSQGASYGDDSNEESNRPLVRLRNGGGSVYYLRAHDATYYGLKPSVVNKVKVDVPSTVPAGAYTLESVSNGIASTGTPITVGSGYSNVTGIITLQNYLASVAGQTVTVSAYVTGTSTLISSTTTTLASDGSYSASLAASGTVDVVFKGSHWLSTRLTATLGSAGTSASASLFNGDCDGNNIVNINDYAILSNAFNATAADANWDARADLDGNGIVNINDYAILSNNFNLSGH